MTGQTVDRSDPVPATRSRRLWRPAVRALLDGALPLIDKRMAESVRPFDRPEMMRPHLASRKFAWTHYGIFVPRLPGPFRYLNIMTLIGATGTVVFDNDYLAAPDARNTATVLSSTAAPGHHFYRAYDAADECAFEEDGSRIAFGDNLIIDNSYPKFRVTGRYDSFDVDLEIVASDQASWFVRNPVYDHVSLLAQCSGTISSPDGPVSISAPCTVEYARCMTPQSLTRRALPESWKLPADFFTYQIVQLDDRHQLLLTDVRASGVTACKLAYIRTVDGSAKVFDDVVFDVLEYADALHVDPEGREMRVPRVLRWQVRDYGRTIVEFEAEIDSEWRYGHGKGYVGAYTYRGSFDGASINGTGYIEWVDCEV